MEGALVKNGGLGFEGVDLELVDPQGAVVSTTRTDYDGYFLFERVPYGSYRIRIAKASAEVIGAPPDLDIQVNVTDEHPVVRTGSTPVHPRPQVASSK